MDKDHRWLKIERLEEDIEAMMDTIMPIPFRDTPSDKKDYWSEFQWTVNDVSYKIDEILDILDELEPDEED